MKLRNLLLSSMTLGLAFAFTACSDDDDQKITKIDLDNITYNSDGVWSDWDKVGNLEIGDYTFSHIWSEFAPGMGISQGFVASKDTDTGLYTPMFDHQFCAITGGGVAGTGSSYIVGNWNTTESDLTPTADRSLLISKKDGSSFLPLTVDITNTTYAYYSMLNGDDYSKKFEKGDKLTVIITGVTANDVKRQITVDLADCGEDAEAGILKTWKKVDLTPLGSVKYIYFTMTSTDVGQYGMNTPAYFALCDFSVLELL